MTTVLNVVHGISPPIIAKPKNTKPGDVFHNWKHCYGQLLLEEGGVIIQRAYLSYENRSDQVPAVKFSAVMAKKEFEALRTDELLYKLELWHESTGARIRYRGNFTDLELVKTELLEESSMKLELSKPLHVDNNGNYEATFVLFYYRDVPGKVPPRKEMDERLCTDIKFTYYDHSKQREKPKQEQEKQEQEKESDDSTTIEEPSKTEAVHLLQ